jgi:hypothetical protein
VLVELDQPGASTVTARLAGLPEVVGSPTLALYAVPGSQRSTPATAPVRLTLAGDALTGFALLIAIASLADIRTRRRASM